MGSCTAAARNIHGEPQRNRRLRPGNCTKTRRFLGEPQRNCRQRHGEPHKNSPHLTPPHGELHRRSRFHRQPPGATRKLFKTGLSRAGFSLRGTAQQQPTSHANHRETRREAVQTPFATFRVCLYSRKQKRRQNCCKAELYKITENCCMIFVQSLKSF